MKALLWMLGELGIKKVPSYEAFKNIQKRIRESVGIPTTQNQSPKGNVFSVNDPSALIAKVSTQFLTGLTSQFTLHRTGPILWSVVKSADTQSFHPMVLFLRFGMLANGETTLTDTF